MNFRDIWLGMSVTDRRALASNIGTSYKYLEKLAGGFGLPSITMVERIRKHLPQVSNQGFIDAMLQAGHRHGAS
jgi:hypothetical protein